MILIPACLLISDRMPVWNQLFGNQGYTTRPQENSGTGSRGASGGAPWTGFAGNMNWMPFFMNFDF